MSTAIITFTRDGTGQCLYTEAIDLSRIGRLHIKRATRIEFDNERGVWRVYDLTGFPMFTAPTRSQCLGWERLHLDSRQRMRSTAEAGAGDDPGHAVQGPLAVA